MAPRVRRPELVCVAGMSWLGDGGTWTVHSIQRAFGERRITNAVVVVCEDPAGDLRELSVGEFVQALNLPFGSSHGHADGITLFEEDLDEDFGVLTSEELAQLRRLRAWIRIWICGDADQHQLALENPRDGMAPHPLQRPAIRAGRVASVDKLLAAMERDGGPTVSRADFYRKAQALTAAKGSLLGLMSASQRRRVAGPLQDVPAELLDACRAYAGTVPEGNTLTIGSHYTAADRYLRNKLNIDPVQYPKRLRNRVVRELLRGQRVTANAASRSSKNGRPKGVQGRFIAAAPYEQIQIDGWDLTATVKDQYGDPINVSCLVAICVCTRIVLGLLLVPRAYTAEDVALLVFEIRKGGDIWPGAESASPALPRKVLVSDNVLTRIAESIPQRTLGSVGVDNGAQMVALAALQVLRDVGADVEIAAPGTGVHKALIEALFRQLSFAIQDWPGAKGRSVAHRGRQPSRPFAVPRHLMEAALRMYVDLVYHQVEHETLGMSPQDKLVVELVAAGAIPVDSHPALAWQLVPELKQVVNDEGLRVANRDYDSPEIQDLKRHSQGDTHFANRPVTLRANPYDPSWILVRDLAGRAVLVPDRDLDQPRLALDDVRGELIQALRANGRPASHRESAIALIGDHLDRVATRLAASGAAAGPEPEAPSDDTEGALWDEVFGDGA